MAIIQNNIEGIRGEALAFIRDAANKMHDTFASIVGGTSAKVEGFFTGDVVGLNVASVDSMKAAIDDYVAKIDEHLNQVKRDADTTQAFKGAFDEQVHAYIDAVCDACGALTSHLKEFKATLEDVKTKYETHEQELKGQLGSQASEVQSSFTRYTE